MKSKKNWWTKRHNKRAERLRAVKTERRMTRAADTIEPLVGSVPDPDENIHEHLQDGLVAGVHRGGEYMVYSNDRTYSAKVDSDLAEQHPGVVVGDKVRFVAHDDHNAVIVGLEPRKSKLVRVREDRTRRSEHAREEAVLAANVDVAVIVAAVTQPAFHPRLVDRYLVMAQYGNIQPLLCLNKSDLVETLPDLAVYQRLGVPIVYTSAATGAGLDRLRILVEGKLSVFTGQSGVGKSSLVNALLQEERVAVGAVRATDGRGKHTTTASTLIKLDENTFVVDTPGIRSLGFWRIDPQTLRYYFPEFGPFASGCAFADCSHTHEPLCAVKAAVEVGDIPLERYESYLRMMAD